VKNRRSGQKLILLTVNSIAVSCFSKGLKKLKYKMLAVVDWVIRKSRQIKYPDDFIRENWDLKSSVKASKADILCQFPLWLSLHSKISLSIFISISDVTSRTPSSQCLTLASWFCSQFWCLINICHLHNISLLFLNHAFTILTYDVFVTLLIKLYCRH